MASAPPLQHIKDNGFLMGDMQFVQVVCIPPEAARGCQTVQGPVNLFYITLHEYNPDDEQRLLYDDPEINFDWQSGPPIK